MAALSAVVRSSGALINEVEFRRCKEDPLYFFKNYWWVQTPAGEGGKMKFDPWPEQENVISTVINDQKVLALKARQIGYSTMIAAISFWEAFFWGGRLIIMLSRRESDSIKLLKKVIFGYRNLPDWMKLRGPKRIDRGKLEFTLENDSQLVSAPSRNDPARGDTAYRIVIDEWAFFENAEDVWASIEPAADVGGRIFALSTARGVGNTFHEFWVNAVEEKNGFTPVFKSWRSNPYRDDDWYAKKVIELPEWQRYQEYPDTPQEAFRRSGKNIFSVDRCMTMLEESGDGQLMEVGMEGEFMRLFNSHSSDLEVWEPPMGQHLYTIGADTAQNVAGGDYSVATVVRCAGWRSGVFYPAAVVARFRAHIDPEDFAYEIDKLGRVYRMALVCPESNTFGQQVISTLRGRCSYWNIYRQNTAEQGKKRLGFHTGTSSKPLIIGQLRRMIAEMEIQVPDKTTIHELMGYVSVERPNGGSKMQGSPHDDCVMALALAVEALNEQTANTADLARQTSDGMTFEMMLELDSMPNDGVLSDTIGRRVEEGSAWFSAG